MIHKIKINKKKLKKLVSRKYTNCFQFVVSIEFFQCSVQSGSVHNYDRAQLQYETVITILLHHLVVMGLIVGHCAWVEF